MIVLIYQVQMSFKNSRLVKSVNCVNMNPSFHYFHNIFHMIFLIDTRAPFLYSFLKQLFKINVKIVHIMRFFENWHLHG